jgi:transcription elongation factor Elf1
MDHQEKRLGDLLEDYCPRCRHLLDHAVASMVGSQVAKVICQTCYTEHAFRHGDAGKKKSDPRATLFDQVLAKVSPSGQEREQTESPASEKAAASRATSPPARKSARGKVR